jgi:hypothetical protein
MMKPPMNPNKLMSPAKMIDDGQSQLPRRRKQSCSSFGGFVALAALGLLLGGQNHAAAWTVYAANFDAGPPDTGWLHYDPINSVVPSYANSYTVSVDPAGGYNYHLQGAASPSPGTVGQARTIAYRSDNYTNFNITADLMPGWAGGGGTDGSYVQGMGLVARLNNIAIGTLSGYGFTYINGAQNPGVFQDFLDDGLSVFRIDHEGTKGIPGSGDGSAGDCELHGLTLVNSKAYRFQFIGKGTHLQGRVYDLANTNTPIAVLDANTAGDSARWTNGPCGLLAINGSSAAGVASSGPVDVTWDNYTASIHSPYEIRDDFNRGSDGAQTYPPWSAPGWVHYDPLGGLGLPPAIYSFPNVAGGDFGYKLDAPAPPIPDGGSARAGSIRQEVSYSDFFASVDVSNWNDAQRMAFGILGRGQTIGLGTTTGYLYTYELGGGTLPSPTAGDTDISILQSEQPNSLPTTSAPPFDNGGSTHLNTGTKYRMSFTAKGAVLTGYVYNPDGTIKSWITASDPNYTSGSLGLISASQGDDAASPTVNAFVTFDNFYADTAEPRLAMSEDSAGNVVLTWPANLASIWTLQTSPSIAPDAVWTEISGAPAQAISYDSTSGLNSYKTPMSASTSMFFRLQGMDPVDYP